MRSPTHALLHTLLTGSGAYSRVAESYDDFRAVITSLATADCLFSLATAATAPGYCRPTIVPAPGVLEITQGRHPMVEVHLSAPFVPNDVAFGGDDGMRQMLLTGLNMGGASLERFGLED